MDRVKIWCVLLLVVGLGSSNTLHAASEYLLDTEKSSLFFVSTKKTNVVETHYFSSLSGAISDTGLASLSIDLSSAETGIEIRNQRLRDLLFKVATFSDATVSLAVNLSSLAAMPIGDSQTQVVSATLSLHGVSSVIDAKLIVTKLSASTLIVQSASPVLLRAGDYNLASGVDALRDIANLDVISYAVPVNFTLFFNTP